MLDKKNLISLMRQVATADRSAPVAYSFGNESFSYSALNNTLSNELNELVGTPEKWRDNHNQFFTIIEQSLSDVVPQKVLARFGDFAEVKTYAQGEKPVFTRKVGRMRAKQFVTRVGLAGVYEVFKLGSESFEVQTSAIGGAVTIGFEEYLDGRVDFSELMDILVEGYEELIYREVAKALQGSIGQLPAANQAASNGFDEAAFDRLISVASAYGTPTIYCTREFAVKMIPQDAGWVSEDMRNAMWNTGYLANYKGVRVVILPQSFEDDTNSKKIIDPGYVWILTGADKPVKIAFEGQMHTRERDNEDWSRDVQTYRKVGVGVMMTNNICAYIDESLKGKLDTIAA